MNFGVIVSAANLIEEDIEDEMGINRPDIVDQNLKRPFNMFTSKKFLEKFRLPKNLARWLCNYICVIIIIMLAVISPHLPNEHHNSRLSKDTIILSTLRFYASGSYQESIAETFYTNISQTTMSRVIQEVTDVIVQELGDDWIIFPTEQEELQRISEAFQEEIRFPCVIGVINCTHISLTAPNQEKWKFSNHNRYYSINIQVTCDDKCRVTSIDAYPGATHDARIWRQSEVKQIIDGWNNGGGGLFYLIGDSGYPLQPSILTSVADAENDAPEAAYNTAFTHTRSIIERVFGIIKRRWRCLHRTCRLSYQPLKAVSFFKACSVPHNIY